MNMNPIFIIGSARNGTTSLENTIAALPEVAGVEHWLHYGSKESNLFLNKTHWGNLSEIDNYIDFVYQYASSDYFQICEGSVEYHLENKRDIFYDFFFDLMDRYAEKKDSRYWITKLDPYFFLFREEMDLFLKALYERYDNPKFIRIKREFKDAFKSYRNMEGSNYELRQYSTMLLPSLILQAARYTVTYSRDVSLIENEVYDISFESYIRNRDKYLNNIVHYLGLGTVNISEVNKDRFQINSSFVNKSKTSVSRFIKKVLPVILTVFQKYLFVPKLIWKTFYYSKKESSPTYHRLLAHEYFRQELINDLSKKDAKGLLEKLESDSKRLANS